MNRWKEAGNGSWCKDCPLFWDSGGLRLAQVDGTPRNGLVWRGCVSGVCTCRFDDLVSCVSFRVWGRDTSTLRYGDFL